MILDEVPDTESRVPKHLKLRLGDLVEIQVRTECPGMRDWLLHPQPAANGVLGVVAFIRSPERCRDGHCYYVIVEHPPGSDLLHGFNLARSELERVADAGDGEEKRA